MNYLVKDGQVISQSDNRELLELMCEPGCEIMNSFPPADKIWDATQKVWKLNPTAQAQANAKTLADLKEEKIQLVNQLCHTKIISGFDSDALEEGELFHYQSDIIDQQNLIGSVVASLTLPEGETVKFRCVKISSNSDLFRDHTKTQMAQVIADGRAVLEAYLEKTKLLKDRINSADNIEALEGLDLVTGW
jgi:hypothetical protein